MRRYKIASLIMIIHGGFMEIGGVLCFIPAMLWGTDKFDIGQYFSFKLPTIKIFSKKSYNVLASYANLFINKSLLLIPIF